MERENKDCSGNGKCAGQVLEKSFDDNVGKNEKAGKGVENLGRVVGKVDIEHIGFDDMIEGERKADKAGSVGYPIKIKKSGKWWCILFHH
jgi:hypothetical protein